MDKTAQVDPLQELKQVNQLFDEIADKPQILFAPSDSTAIIKGAKGTIIHLDPTQLQTINGSPLGEKIQIELLELNNNSSMLLHNTQTVSDGQILVSGGAYYLNMTSDGNQLKIKSGESLEVEFPKQTDEEMEFFTGARDSLGQMNWKPTNRKFISNAIDTPASVGTNPTSLPFRYYDEDLQMDLTIYDTTSTSKEFGLEVFKETYQSISLLNFGWINCDRWYQDPRPKRDVEISIKNDSVNAAIIYAVFTDINSIMEEYYWSEKKDKIAFKNIPIGKSLKIIAVSVMDESPYVFETTINTQTKNKVHIDFSPSSKAELKELIEKLN
ncbi:hypothetical protein [Croceimicrobium hydrocarbonivorans]|uniref:Uncharacterized protein n=1 Tax=Croceimicrobium hydrocarbonivorans TaxID=2761580 RepID=A0A7H0VHE7_9FLAO|nr:hypothetical protein [Croceimicrobium hydrocarbonivorans]QNR25145.1 hypothetical protein H4K34_04720 [Croceimicrobium hydrocarbonivorans]